MGGEDIEKTIEHVFKFLLCYSAPSIVFLALLGLKILKSQNNNRCDYDCIRCGACCIDIILPLGKVSRSTVDAYKNPNHKHHSKAVEKVNRFIAEACAVHGNVTFWDFIPSGYKFIVAGMLNGPCEQLKIVDGKAICGIYGAHPDYCKYFEKGSESCQNVREYKLGRQEYDIPLNFYDDENSNRR